MERGGKKKKAKVLIYLVRSYKRGGTLPRTGRHAGVQAQHGNDGRLFQTHTKPKPAERPPHPERQQDAPAHTGALRASQGSAAEG